MITKQQSALSSAIYRNMQLKNTNELLAIWKRNDRLEWSDEALSIVHDILVERTGSASFTKPNIGRRNRHKQKKEKKGEKQPLPSLLIVFYITVFLLVFPLLLLYFVTPEYDDQWFEVLFLGSMAFSFLTPGFYFGWKSWFQGEMTKQEISKNLPNMKKTTGGLYSLGTFFLPDRFIPTYLLLLMKFISVGLLLSGMGMLQILLQVL